MDGSAEQATSQNAVGVIAIALGLRATLSPGKRVTASWVLMLISGVGFFASGVFMTDEMDAQEVTVSGGIHILSFLVTIISLLIAAWMLRGVFARDDGWRHFQHCVGIPGGCDRRARERSAGQVTHSWDFEHRPVLREVHLAAMRRNSARSP